MPSVCCYFQVHQPIRLRHYTFFDIGREHAYENEEENRAILQRVAQSCYLPAAYILLEQIRHHGGRFKVAFSISGIALEQFARYQPAVLKLFQDLADTGCVEFLNETYHHSLAFLFSEVEFHRQVELHRQAIESCFKQTPAVFRNTELIFNNDVARVVEKMGFTAILAEGADPILGWRSPNHVYRPQGCRNLRLLLKNYRLSDAIAFRFNDPTAPDHPLSGARFADRIHQTQGVSDVINLFMDFETFGEHHAAETGIFDFMKDFPAAILRHPEFSFATPSEAVRIQTPVARLDVPQLISWADVERDLSAWVGNDMQKDAIQAVYALENKILRLGHPALLQTWRNLQTSDHFYYMCTKWLGDGDIHKYFNPFKSPYDAYINYMNIITDLSQQIDAHLAAPKPGRKTPPPPARKAAPKARVPAPRKRAAATARKRR
jgi:alpha-amylase